MQRGQRSARGRALAGTSCNTPALARGRHCEDDRDQPRPRRPPGRRTPAPACATPESPARRRLPARPQKWTFPWPHPGWLSRARPFYPVEFRPDLRMLDSAPPFFRASCTGASPVFNTSRGPGALRLTLAGERLGRSSSSVGPLERRSAARRDTARVDRRGRAASDGPRRARRAGGPWTDSGRETLTHATTGLLP